MSELDWYLQINLKARHLHLLVAIDTYRNLTQVADVTHVTVPAVSKALAELEKGMGLTLFSRTAQGLVPTAYGECLIRHARDMLTILHQARDELKALSSGAEGKVHIGMLPASASVLLPQALSLLKQRSPGTNVVVIEGTTGSLLPELWQGRLDLVVGRLPPPDTLGSFEEKELLEDPVTLVTGRHHPLARKKNLKWADLHPYPWILPPPGSILRDPLERALEVNGVPLSNNYIETLSIHVVRAHLQVSDFIAVMADTPANDPTQPLHTLPLSLPRLLRPAGVLWNRNRGLTPSAQLMVACLEEAAQRLADKSPNTREAAA
ncbi:LysR substrate-binding domain-containing protein [Paraburkholderia tropica]|uniref:DNA-binding transcriptional LysR family regulator n=2 Tax=Paraburkholderia tropica TaxID=92647 RepID=A0A1A5XIG2_9BURK|nr:LysR substrate-binding domain-containing protein [Paraburkholderia tropica]MBN3811786.1 LysR family transcriptional regulator [Paraburkholderia sp. Ac-20347]OBR53212.1 LysR family transcriptional regulator [Paraburkholderia tropica]PXX10739.1 DNA-binding transcriptional LysR family regulator [Paraburkholderia tropica]PZW75707.1 DNA-binding transcriptional LysR family regulator [Paraburkholderia tropica]RQN34042.1 LysR family transcriptional regulator [Paraburkholderia tropica]